MAKFSDFIKEDTVGQTKKNDEENIEKIMAKYSDYSEDELMSEFIKESVRKRENGELTEEQLDRISNLLKPYLNDMQKQKLDDLFGVIK